MNKRDFPRVHFYDQDFVDIYDRTWAWVHDFWHSTGDGKQGTEGFFIYPEADGNFLNQYETIFSSFFFVYSNKNYTPNSALDFFMTGRKKTEPYAIDMILIQRNLF